MSFLRVLAVDDEPPALDELGLVGALEEVAAQYDRDDLRVSVESPEELPPLSAAAEVACYLIAREAMTNVVRHAGATGERQPDEGEGEPQVLAGADDGRGDDDQGPAQQRTRWRPRHQPGERAVDPVGQLGEGDARHAEGDAGQHQLGQEPDVEAQAAVQAAVTTGSPSSPRTASSAAMTRAATAATEALRSAAPIWRSCDRSNSAAGSGRRLGAAWRPAWVVQRTPPRIKPPPRTMAGVNRSSRSQTPSRTVSNGAQLPTVATWLASSRRRAWFWQASPT